MAKFHQNMQTSGVISLGAQPVPPVVKITSSFFSSLHSSNMSYNKYKWSVNGVGLKNQSNTILQTTYSPIKIYVELLQHFSHFVQKHNS